MAKLWNQMINALVYRNATPRSSGGARSINRDPKAIQVKRVGYQFSEGGSGRESFEETPVDFYLIDNAIGKDSYIMQSIMKYSELTLKSGWYFSGKNDQSLEYLQLRLEMMAVATGVPTEELWSGIVDDIVKYANSFVVKAPAKNGVGLPPGVSAIPIAPRKDPIGGYFRLPPHTVSISRDQNGNILKYKQEVEGADKPIQFNPQDIIHFTVNKPVGRPFGEPWISPVLEDVRLLRKVEENASLLLYKHIFPLLTYTVGIDKPGFEASDEEIEELQGIIESLPTDGAIVLPERHKVEAVNVSTIDGKPYLDYFEQRVFTGLGMSAVDMGRGDTANRNTADAMSGIKTDRIKGWQRTLQTQIDKFIIDEILAEGGYDPLVNPDFNIDFVFHEIEQEKKIAKENHVIQKWYGNLITFDEARVEIGKEPVTDESRLFHNMTGKAQTNNAVDNKNAPENQHGKRDGPKSKTEFAQKFLEENKNIDNKKTFYEDILSIYRSIESDVVCSLEKYLEKKTFPLEDPKEWIAYFHFNREVFLRKSSSFAKEMMIQGIQQAREDVKRESYANVDINRCIKIMREYVDESLNRFEKMIKKAIISKIKDCQTKTDVYLEVKGVFSAVSHRLKFLSNTLSMKAFNFGYALSLKKYGEQSVRSKYTGTCHTCLEYSNKSISLQQFSSLDEFALFYRIPPWHPNCSCRLEYFKGGEN